MQHEPVERAGESLGKAQFDTVDIGPVAIAGNGRLVEGDAAENTGDIGIYFDDEVIQAFVEGRSMDRAIRAHIIFDRRIEVPRLGRQQIGISELALPLAVIRFLDGEMRRLLERCRTDDRTIHPRTQDQIVLGLVAKVYARQPVIVALVDTDRGDEHGVVGCGAAIGQGAIFLDQQHVIAGQSVVRMLVAQAVDEPQVRAFPATEEIAGHDVLIDGEILHRTVIGAVGLLQLEIREIVEEEACRIGIAGQRRDVGQAIGLTDAERIGQSIIVVLVELDIPIEALVTPPPLETDLGRKLAIVGGKAAADVEFGGPFLVLCIRQRDVFDILEPIGAGGEKRSVDRVGYDRIERNAWIGIVETEGEAAWNFVAERVFGFLGSEVAFELSRIDAAVL